ncbi:MAG: hypothetical protein ACHQ52_05015 [Candidatus Eisenbacteria bacterium]
MAVLECQFCGHLVQVSESIARDTECAGCGRDLRCCRQCRHYDPLYNNQCRETEADPQPEKDRRNFCEFFEFTRARFVARGAAADRASAARARLEGLFGGAPGAPKPASEARRKLEDLFKKDDKKDPERE